MTLSEHHKVLGKTEIDRLMSSRRGTFHWLNTKNRKLIVTALDHKRNKVTLHGLSWKVFGIKYNDTKTKIYVSPLGEKAPFTPATWLDVDNLRKEVA